MFRQSKPKKFKTDIDIYKKNGDYDNNKIAKTDIEKINFAYKNATACMKEIEDDIKTISARSTSIFGYLTVIVLALVAVVFKDFLMPSNESAIGSNKELIIEISILLLSTYIAVAVFMIWTLISPKPGYSAHSEPEKLLMQKTFQHDIKLIKILEIQMLQDRIKNNKNLLKNLRGWMTLYKGCLCLSLPVAFAWGLFA